MWLSMAAIILTAGAGENSAVAQFKKMEQQVLKCKTLQTEVDIVAGAETETFLAMKGRMLVAPGNKVRMELEGEIRKEKDKMVMVSDGTKMSMSNTKRPAKDQETSKTMTEAALASYSRGGIVISLLMARSQGPDEKPKAFDIDKDMAILELKLGKKEALGGGEAQAIEYKVSLEGNKEPLLVTVWIDLKTNLPIKRVATVTEGKMTITITEKYAKTVLGCKLDEKEFVLPK